MPPAARRPTTSTLRPVRTAGRPPPRLLAAFDITPRGSTLAREVRGGVATFFTMVYIIVLNPIILASATDSLGHRLSTAQLTTSTALVAAVMTIIMGVVGNVPLAVAVAAGLGLNGVLAFQIAPTMPWPDAMGLVVLEGAGIVLLVLTGLRQAIMAAIPLPLKQAISVGIGLFIAFIGLVDAGVVTTPKGAAVPVQLGATGRLTGWPVVVFVFGLALTVVLIVRRVKGAILLSIVAATVLAIVLNSVATVHSWGLITPRVPDRVVGAPDFGLLGQVSVVGGIATAGAVTAVVFLFTLLLSDFFDAMGTIIGVSNQAGLLDERGRLARIGRILFVDGLAAVAGGLASASSNTCFVESSAGVGEGARTGLANLVTGLLFVVALFLTPVTTIVPVQAATPALVVVGFMLMRQVADIPWSDYDIAVPAFLTIILMPFTYSITNGIGAGFICYVLIKAARGKWCSPGVLLWVISAFFAAYFALDPIQRALGG